MNTSDHTDRLGLERFDAVTAPDQWADIVRRAESTGSAGSNVVTMRRGRGWYLAAAASVVALIGGLVVVTQLRDDGGTTPIDQPGTGVSDPTACVDESQLDTIVDMLRSGLPTYDYQPAADLDELLGRNNVVVRGEITSAERSATNSATTISIARDRLLVDGLGGTTGTIEGFETASLWADRAQADPLAEPVAFDQLEVIAFLSELDGVPSGWTPDIEGWFVACDGGPARGVIETPTFLDLSSLDALEAQITGVDPDTTVTTEPAPIDTSSTTTSSTTTSSTTEPGETMPEAAVDERWTPTCVDEYGSGSSPAADSGLDTFGPLASEPGLDITLPAFLSSEQAAPAAVNVAVGRVDGGTAVLARPYEGDDTDVYVLSVVDDDGSVRWRRCIDIRHAGSMLTSPGADLIVVAEYELGTGSAAPRWRRFDVASGRDATPLDIADELQTVTVNSRYALFTLVGERSTTAADEMALLDLTSGEITTIPYPDTTTISAFRFDFQITDLDDGGFRILQRVSDDDVVVGSVWVDGAWRSDDTAILEATPIRAVNSFDDAVGWEGRNGLGDVVWSRPDLLDIRREGFSGDVSGAVTVINACRERDDTTGFCGGAALIGLDTLTGETLWERSGLRGVSAIGDGFAIITNDASDGWEMIDTLTGDLVDLSQQWAGTEAFSQECCGAGDFIWVGRDGGVVFAVNENHVRVRYPQARSDGTISISLMD